MGFSYNLIVTFQLAFLLLLVSSTPLSITTDKEALISFKSQLVVHKLPNPLSTWDENLSPCNWTGVSCDDHRHRVIGLNLSGLRMAGSITPHLSNLSFLRSLELQNNQLSGNLPHHLGNLFRLTTLNLSFNSIVGVIPPNISRCQHLRVLDLMQNKISGKVPLQVGLLTHLQVLNLAGNHLSGDIPSSLPNISSLVHLNLGTNTFSGPIPNDLARLTNLEFLDLTINNLTGTVPPSVYNMSSLKFLSLASNYLWGDLPGDVAITLPNLLVFNVCVNKFTGTIPWSLHNHTSIKMIRMANNLLHGGIPPGLGNLPNLEIYNIGFNRIIGGFDFLQLLTNSTRLNILAFDGNLLEGGIPKSVGNLSKALTKLYMGGNDIYGTIPTTIGDLKSLGLLSLSDSSVSGEIPSEIGQLKELRVLGLADAELSGEIPDSLGNLKLLTKIDLSKNELVGSIPKTFGNLQSLIYMDLSDNKLNGSIPIEILNLPHLSAFLNLSQNQLTGSLPVEVESLENVAVINISNNQLSGNIPRSIGNCKSLEQLLLARNMFFGPIPETLGSVKGLGTLDLSSNQLSGKIPLSLQNLHSLQLLDLSFNNLEGRVPTNGVFDDPSKVHLESNRNLCSLSCNSPRHRGRKSTILYIIISVSAAASLCFVIGFIWYMRRGKKILKDSFVPLKAEPQMVSYNELRGATDNFNEENIVGRGSFGVAYKGLLHGVDVAVKVLDTTMAKSRKTFLAECAALRHVRHRNLVKLMTVCSSIDSKNEEFLALIYEFMSNGSLDDWISGKRRDGNGMMRFNVFDRLSYAIGIASAVDYLHNEIEIPIVHCDLKPSNVLLDGDMTPKVADFGLAKLLMDPNNHTSLSSAHTLRGSIGYIPPEYGYGVKPSKAGDVYSYGIIVLELFTGRSPTLEMFTAGLSIKSWVQEHFPISVEEVIDLELLQQMNDISRDEDYSSRPQSLHDCMITILGVGLSCAAESVDARISIRDALTKLKNVAQILQKHDFVDSDGF
ncbi:hypothetical protein ACS0TY_018787 [Phlomoides rotata]